MSDKATFAPCPNWLLRRRDVPATAKLLYARIVQYVGNNEMAYPSLPTLADEIGLHRSRVIAHLKALETLKLIRVHRTFGRGNQYELLSHPWSKTSSVSATSSESASATSSISTTAPVAETALLPVAFPLPKENKVKEHVKRSPEKNTPATVSIPDSLNVPEFRTAWSEFQEHWKQLRKRLTPLAAKKQLAALAEIGVERAVIAINHSIKSGWQSIHEPKGEQTHDNRSGRISGTPGKYARAIG